MFLTIEDEQKLKNQFIYKCFSIARTKRFGKPSETNTLVGIFLFWRNKN